MSCVLSNVITYRFLSETQRQKMVTDTSFVCLYGSSLIRYDATDKCFWEFRKEEKVKLTLAQVRKFPEVKLFNIKLTDFTKGN